jgi:hypothetical protein
MKRERKSESETEETARDKKLLRDVGFGFVFGLKYKKCRHTIVCLHFYVC